jgi:hypothetical protein
VYLPVVADASTAATCTSLLKKLSPINCSQHKPPTCTKRWGLRNHQHVHHDDLAVQAAHLAEVTPGHQDCIYERLHECKPCNTALLSKHKAQDCRAQVRARMCLHMHGPVQWWPVWPRWAGCSSCCAHAHFNSLLPGPKATWVRATRTRRGSNPVHQG